MRKILFLFLLVLSNLVNAGPIINPGSRGSGGFSLYNINGPNAATLTIADNPLASVMPGQANNGFYNTGNVTYSAGNATFTVVSNSSGYNLVGGVLTATPMALLIPGETIIFGTTIAGSVGGFTSITAGSSYFVDTVTSATNANGNVYTVSFTVSNNDPNTPGALQFKPTGNSVGGGVSVIAVSNSGSSALTAGGLGTYYWEIGDKNADQISGTSIIQTLIAGAQSTSILASAPNSFPFNVPSVPPLTVAVVNFSASSSTVSINTTYTPATIFTPTGSTGARYNIPLTAGTGIIFLSATGVTPNTFTADTGLILSTPPTGLITSATVAKEYFICTAPTYASHGMARAVLQQ